ncbi:MAG: methyltransferase domain-containing protein [Bacteroidetes bacterium]|nr:MAG: methyltransferase domain-containing protein [Bacteroidota bacterium]
MDILNRLPEDRFEAIDDLLAFISIYDDEERTRRYFELFEAHRSDIAGKVCVELGCGLGLMSEKLARLGARRVYAVERNPHLFALAQKRLAAHENVVLVHADARQFVPPEPVDVLVHEFYGQLLYDEELHLLDGLGWQPRLVLPDGGKLRGGLVWAEAMADEVVTPEVVRQLEGALVSGLFDEEGLPLQFDVLEWRFGQGLQVPEFVSLEGRSGDLLYLGLEVQHDGQPVCQAGICANWSYAWTWRAADRFRLWFEPGERAPEALFEWLTPA